jgi:phytanoyl-CoA hydroxylase
MRLSEAQKRFYAENGYLAVEGVFSPGHVAALARRFEELCEDWQGEAAKRVGLAQEPAVVRGQAGVAGTGRTVRSMARLAAHEPLFHAHATDPGLVGLVADLIGEPLSLYVDQAMLKPPRYGSEKPPHQDNAYFKIRPDDAVITCWCALDDATAENGCLHYFPGSHRLGGVAHEKIPDTPHLVPKGVDPGEAVAVPIRAGGVLFHHGLTLHTSPPNRSDRWRRAYICHYVRSDAEMTALRPDSPPLLKVR